MNMNNIKQFKLTSGEEIVCEVVEWASEEDPDMVVKNSFKLIVYNNPATSTKYYTFTPWMIFQDDEDMFQIINSIHIVAEANPSTKLLEQYFVAIKNEQESDEETKKKIDQYISGLKKMLGDLELSDSDDPGGNIVKFPFGGRVH